MGDRVIALAGLTTMPMLIGIVVSILLRHIGMSDVVCATIGAAIAVPGAIAVYALLMRDLRRQDDEE